MNAKSSTLPAPVILVLLVAFGLAMVLLSAAPAAADSMTFVKGHNVWLASPDGSGGGIDWRGRARGAGR